VKLDKAFRNVSLLVAALCVCVGVAAADYDLRLHTYPNPFFAGHQDADVAFYVPAGGTLSIYIYDFEGKLVRTLIEGDRRTPGMYEGIIKWDGRDDNYDVVAPGPYVVVLELTIQGELYRDTFVAIAKR
jgi:flagellar hook assembly protein FlgD